MSDLAGDIDPDYVEAVRHMVEVLSPDGNFNVGRYSPEERFRQDCRDGRPIDPELEVALWKLLVGEGE